jgi:hypothetical protein
MPPLTDGGLTRNSCTVRSRVGSDDPSANSPEMIRSRRERATMSANLG